MASQQSLPEEEKEEVALELSKVPAAEVEIVGPVLVRSKLEELERKAAAKATRRASLRTLPELPSLELCSPHR